jgi:hypothetical protein
MESKYYWKLRTNIDIKLHNDKLLVSYSAAHRLRHLKKSKCHMFPSEQN